MHNIDIEQYLVKFKKKIVDIYESTNDIGKLFALGGLSGNYCDELLKQVNEDAIKKQKETMSNTLPVDNNEVEQPVIKELDFVKPADTSNRPSSIGLPWWLSR